MLLEPCASCSVLFVHCFYLSCYSEQNKYVCICKMGGNKNSTFFLYHQLVADHQTPLMDLCFCIVICRRLLG